MENPEKPNVQELIELLKTDPNAFYDKMGIAPAGPERTAQLKQDYAGLTWEEFRDRRARELRGEKTEAKEPGDS